MAFDAAMIEAPSPNFDERTLPISMLVLHYTGMPDAASAINWLANPDSKVSAHYVVTEDGQTVRMVDESKRAWHAGRCLVARHHATSTRRASASRSSIPAMNGAIALSPKRRSKRSSRSSTTSCSRHKITRGNVVGHSDIAPARKQDPGELFPWDKLARLRLALPRPTRNLMDPHWIGQRLHAGAGALRL